MRCMLLVCWKLLRWALCAGCAGGDALYATLLLELLKVLEVPEVMRRVLLCMLEAMEGELCTYAGGY